MLSSKETPKTSPAALKVVDRQLLTPPPTCGLDWDVRFAEDANSPTTKRLKISQELFEPFVTEYIETQEFSDESLGVTVSDDSSGPSQASSSAGTQSTSVPTSLLDKRLARIDDTPDTPTVTEPFPFMKLPLSIRQQVYNILLVIPALICARQKHTSYHDEKRACLYAERRELLPGISYALVQLAVGGYKFRFTRFCSTNASILRVSKEVNSEAKAVMYGRNEFEIVCPSAEISPPPDYKIPLFPRGYQRLIRKLTVRVRSPYPLQWLMSGGYAELKDAYRGLETLTTIFEMETAKKGFGKRFCKNDNERWVLYVKRLHQMLTVALFGNDGPVKKIPLWIEFRVLFDGERYDDILKLGENDTAGISGANVTAIDEDRAKEEAARLILKRGVIEAFELLKKGAKE